MTNPNQDLVTLIDHTVTQADTMAATGDFPRAAALASIASLSALGSIVDYLGGALSPTWQRFHYAHSDPFLCLCGADAFALYPLRAEYTIEWWACNNANCDALWSMDDPDHNHAPSLVSGGPDECMHEPPWNIHDLVRHRPRGQLGQNEQRPVEYVAMLQSRDSDDTGWWNATVLRVVNPPAHTAPPIVGQGVRLREGVEVNRVARFP